MNTPKLRFATFKGDWNINRLNVLFSIRSSGDLDNNLISLIKTETHKFPVFGNSVTNEGILGYYPHYEEEAPALTITGRGVNIGTPFYRRVNFNAVGRLLVLHTLNNQTNPLFFSQLLSNLKIFNETTGVPQLTAPAIGNYKVAYPTLQEQDKIALFFDLFSKKIKLQQEKIDLLKEQKKGYMLNIFNNPTWKEIRLGDFSTIKGRLGWKGLKQEEYVEEGPYLIAGKHINEGIIDWNKCDKIPLHRYEESMEIALEKDDIIFSKDGSLGNPAFIRDLPNKATINSTMMLVRVDNKNKLNSNFVYHILNSHIFNKLIYQKVSGSSIPHLFQADMKEFSFKAPEDIKEQIQISNFFNTLDRKIHLELKKLELLKSQKQAFMQQMFI